jgi:hypothetical protein
VILGDEVHFSPDVGQPLFPAGNLNVFKQFVVGFKEGVSVGDKVEIDLLFTSIEFGGQLDASFGANFGLEFGLCLGGNADFEMGFQPMVILPDSYPSEIPIPLTVNENMLDTSHFTTTFPPLGKMYADLILHLEADVFAEACVFGCFYPLDFLGFPLSTCDFPALPSGDKLFNLSKRCDPALKEPKYCAIELASFNRSDDNTARMLNVGADNVAEFLKEPYKEFSLGLSSDKTFTANPGDNTISIVGTNPLPRNSPVRVSSDGTLPLGLKKTKIYYTTKTGSPLSLSNSPSGLPVSIMSLGDGTHKIALPEVEEEGDPLEGRYGSLSIAAPTINTTSIGSGANTSDVLRSSGAENVLGVGVDVAQMAADFLFPPIVPPLSDNGSLGPVNWNYTLAGLDVGPAVQLGMDFEMTWNLVITEMTFSKPVQLYTGANAVFPLNAVVASSLSATGAPVGSFHLTNCGPNAMPLVYMITDKVFDGVRDVPKVPQDPVQVQVTYALSPKLKTVVSLPFIGRVSYEVMSAGAGIDRVGNFGFGPLVEGDHKFKFGEFDVYNGDPAELDSTGVGKINFTLQFSGPPSFDWNPDQLTTTTYNWIEKNSQGAISNWFEDSGSGLKSGYPGEGGGNTSTAKVIQNVQGPRLFNSVVVESLQVASGRTLSLEASGGPRLEVVGLLENSGDIYVRGGSRLDLSSRESVLCGSGRVFLEDGAALRGSKQENPAVCIYNTIIGSGYAFDQRFDLNTSVRSTNHNMGMLLADGNGITGGDGVRVLINTPLDGRPGDLTWQITQPEGLVIDSGAGVTNKMVILPDGDYNFTIFHSTDNGKADYTLSDKKRMPLREGGGQHFGSSETTPFHIYNGGFLKTGAYTVNNLGEFGSMGGGRLVLDGDQLLNRLDGKITSTGAGSETHVRARNVEHSGLVEARNGGRVELYRIRERSVVNWNAGRSFREDCGHFRAFDNGVVHLQGTQMNGGCFFLNGTGSLSANNSEFYRSVIEIGNPNDPTGLVEVLGPNQNDNRWREFGHNRFTESCLNNYGTFRVSGEAEFIDSVLFANHGTVEVANGGILRIRANTATAPGASAEGLSQPGCANMTETALVGGVWDISGELWIYGDAQNNLAEFSMIGADIAPARISSGTSNELGNEPPQYDPGTSQYITANPGENPLEDGLNRPFDKTKVLSEGRPAEVIIRGRGLFSAVRSVETNCGTLRVLEGSGFGGEFRTRGNFTNKSLLFIGEEGDTRSVLFETKIFNQIGPKAHTMVRGAGLLRTDANLPLSEFNISGGTFTSTTASGVLNIVSDTVREGTRLRVESPLVFKAGVEAPANLTAYRDRIGETFEFLVTGSSSGAIWGSGVYTDDSPLAVAAVHAGVLGTGEQRVVSVTILPGQTSYESNSQNGIVSNAYGDWLGSYRIGTASVGAQVQERVTIDIGSDIVTIKEGAEVTIHGAAVDFPALTDKLRNIQGSFTLSGDGVSNAPDSNIASGGFGTNETLTNEGELNILGFSTRLFTDNLKQTGRNAFTRIGVGAFLDAKTIDVAGGDIIVEIGSRPAQLPGTGVMRLRSDLGADFQGALVIDFKDELATANSTVDIGDTWTLIANTSGPDIKGIDSFTWKVDGVEEPEGWLPAGSELILFEFPTNHGPRGLGLRVAPIGGVFFNYDGWATAAGFVPDSPGGYLADPFRLNGSNLEYNVTKFLYGIDGGNSPETSHKVSFVTGDDGYRYAQLSFRRPFGADADYEFYASPDLKTWAVAPMILTPGVATSPALGALETVTLKSVYPTPDEMLYFRIEAKFNPDNFDHGEIPSKAVQWGSGLNNFNQSLENNVSPNPSYVVEAGKVLFLRVQGSAGPDSGIWGGTASNGTDRNFIYRDRTAIKLAAVHAGLLGDGEYGILKVTFIEEQATSFIGSTQNEGTQDEIESLNVNPDGAPYSYMIEFHSED